MTTLQSLCLVYILMRVAFFDSNKVDASVLPPTPINQRSCVDGVQKCSPTDDLLESERLDGLDNSERVAREVDNSNTYEDSAYNSTFADGFSVKFAKLHSALLEGLKLQKYLRRHNPVSLEMYITFHGIVHFSKVSQVTTTDLWVYFFWQDDFYKWNPQEYDGIESMALGLDQAWTPDYVVKQSSNQRFVPRTTDSRVNVDYKGAVYLFFPLLQKINCDISVTDFPFDQHTCQIVFTINTLTKDAVDLKLHEKHDSFLKQYAGNSDWNIIRWDVWEEEDKNRHDCKGCVFPVIIYEITIRRNWHLSFVYYYLPNILINIKAIFQFFLPIESMERIKSGASVFFGVILYMLSVNNVFSQSVDIPVWIVYVAVTTALVGASQVITSMTLYYHYQGIHDNFHTLPRWARKWILNNIAKVVGLEPSGYPLDMWQMLEGHVSHVRLVQDTTQRVAAETHSADVDKVPEVKQDAETSAKKDTSRFLATLQKIKRRLSRRTSEKPVFNSVKAREVADDLNDIKQGMDLSNDENLQFNFNIYKILKHGEIADQRVLESLRMNVLQNEWKQCATVLDRCSLLLYALFTIVLWIYVVAQIPFYD